MAKDLGVSRALNLIVLSLVATAALSITLTNVCTALDLIEDVDYIDRDQTGSGGVSDASGAPGETMLMDDNNLDSAISRYPYFVLECWAEGCEPCLTMDSTIEEMARELQGEVAFGKLCVNRNPQARHTYDISEYPTLLIFKGGSLVDRYSGNLERPDVEEIILRKL